MNERDEIFLWVQRAEEDYQLALSAMRHKTPLTYGTTFHAQQCAEKYLKALLLFKQESFPRTHDLAALNRLCQQAGIILPINDDDLESLSAYAVEVRYPGTQPTVEEGKDALRIARKVRNFTRKIFNKKT
jgi:HEPN domain-containing protein